MASALIVDSQRTKAFLTEFGSDGAGVRSAVGKADRAFFNTVLMCNGPDGCSLKK